MAIAVITFPVPQGKKNIQSNVLKNSFFHLDESLAPSIEFLYSQMIDWLKGVLIREKSSTQNSESSAVPETGVSQSTEFSFG